MVAFVGPNCSPCLRSQDSIDGTMIVPSASKSTLRCDDRGSIAVAVSVSAPALIVVPIVTIRIVAIRIISVIWERREEWEAKRVDEDNRMMVKMIEAIVMEHSRSAVCEHGGTPCSHGAAHTTGVRGSADY